MEEKIREVEIFGKKVKLWNLSCCGDGHKRTLYLEITDICNAKCPFCSATAGNHRVDLNKLKIVLDELIPSIVDKISITGGEPLLYPELKELFELLDSYKNKGLKFYAITTNGVHLKEKINILEQSGIQYINISRSAISDAANDELFGVRTIHIPDLAKIVMKSKKEFRMNHVRSKYSRLEDLVYLCKMTGIKDLLIRKDYFDTNPIETFLPNADVGHISDKCSCYGKEIDGVYVEYREIDVEQEKILESSNDYVRNLVFKSNNKLYGGWNETAPIIKGRFA